MLNKSSQSDLEEPRRHPLRQRTTTPQSLHRYNATPHIYTKIAPTPWTITTPSNTPIPRLTPFTIPNGIRIHSAVLPQYTFRTDRQTDKPTDGLGDTPVRIRAIRSIDYIATRLIMLYLNSTRLRGTVHRGYVVVDISNILYVFRSFIHYENSGRCYRLA